MDIFCKIEGDTWEEKLQYSIECKCCIRHNTDKPKICTMDRYTCNTKLAYECSCHVDIMQDLFV